LGRAFPIFVCTRKPDLGRFTVDRLISIFNRLGARVEVKVPVRWAYAAMALTNPGRLPYA
jgi:hypothetical protein